MKMKTPSPEEAEYCLSLRCRARRGEYMSLENMKHFTKMVKTFPEWYRKTDSIVFNRTVPFGSNVQKDESLL